MVAAFPRACAAFAAMTAMGCRARDERPVRPAADAPVLLFDGAGTSPNDVAAVEAILDGERLLYSTVSEAQLDAMSAADLGSYGLLIVPGGNFVTMGRALSSRAIATVRAAVGGGLGYLGLCAGAFLAGRFERAASFDLASGVQFRFYSAEERGVRKEAVTIARTGGAPLETYWEDGPELSGWGSIVARYPDGTPAVVEGTSGRGWLVLSGVHPEAPESWRRGMSFTTPVDASHAFAASLVEAALRRVALPSE